MDKNVRNTINWVLVTLFSVVVIGATPTIYEVGKELGGTIHTYFLDEREQLHLLNYLFLGLSQTYTIWVSSRAGKLKVSKARGSTDGILFIF